MLKFNGLKRNCEPKFFNWRFDLFLDLHLTRPATPPELKKLGDGITAKSTGARVPIDEFVDWCARMGSDVWIHDPDWSGCGVYVDPKVVPSLLLTWEFPKKYLQVGHVQFPNLHNED